LAKQDGVDAVHAEDVGYDGVKERGAERVAVGTPSIGVAGVETDEGRDLDGADKIELDFLELDEGGDDGGTESG